jgi:predicted DNA-binding transcriptional regulator AlpA
MKRTGSQTRKKSLALPGQLDLFGAGQVANAQKPANDPLAQIPPKSAGIISAVAPGSAAQTKAPQLDAPAQTPPPSAANSNAPENRPRGRPRKLTPPVTTTAPVKTEPARDPHVQALRDEWWNSQMVCVFLKISRKTLWERRRAKDLNFPQPNLLGGARNLYRASAIREWAERMADAEL